MSLWNVSPTLCMHDSFDSDFGSEQQGQQLDLLLERLRTWLQNEQMELLRKEASTSSSSDSTCPPRRGSINSNNKTLKTLVENVLDSSIRLRQSNARVREKLLPSPIRAAKSRPGSRRIPPTSVMTPDRHPETVDTQTPPSSSCRSSSKKSKSCSSRKQPRLVSIHV